MSCSVSRHSHLCCQAGFILFLPQPHSLCKIVLNSGPSELAVAQCSYVGQMSENKPVCYFYSNILSIDHVAWICEKENPHHSQCLLQNKSSRRDLLLSLSPSPPPLIGNGTTSPTCKWETEKTSWRKEWCKIWAIGATGNAEEGVTNTYRWLIYVTDSIQRT